MTGPVIAGCVRRERGEGGVGEALRNLVLFPCVTKKKEKKKKQHQKKTLTDGVPKSLCHSVLQKSNIPSASSPSPPLLFLFAPHPFLFVTSASEKTTKVIS